MNIYFNNALIGTTTVQCSVTLPNRIDYYSSHKVNDEVRGYLVFDGTWNFIPPCSVQKEFKIQKLALILESPHKNEYQSNSYIPIGPARGTSCERIERCIVNRQWVRQLDSNCVYEICVMNAIQYQCSAWNYISGFSKLDTVLRNNLFKKMWTGFARKSFVHRIEDYSPDKIVNCCTGMTTDNTGNVCPQRNSLADLVEKAIQTSFQGSHICDYHPATLGKKQWK
jgi:hypothetical protein